MEREFKMCEGKQLMMNKGVNAYMKAYDTVMDIFENEKKIPSRIKRNILVSVSR